MAQGEPSVTEERPSGRPDSGTDAIARAIVAGTAEPGLGHYVRALDDAQEDVAARAARVIEAVVHERPDLGSPHIERLVRLLASGEGRVARACATVLPEIARVAPAKVAKHIGGFQAGYDAASETAREAMLRTWAVLCGASIAYQARLAGGIEHALAGAAVKDLARWAELALPVLKGEPYAQVRAVVERRLGELPRAAAQKLAERFHIRFRPTRP
jgi:hypothetical protein